MSSFGTDDSGLIRKSVTRCTSPVSVKGASFLAFLALLASAMPRAALTAARPRLQPCHPPAASWSGARLAITNVARSDQHEQP